MSTFAERYDKILKDNNLDIPDAIKITGLSKDTIYNLTSKKTAEKYESFTNLFKICDTPDQVYYLATGKHLPAPSPQNPTKELEVQMIGKLMESTVAAMSAQMDKMRADFDEKMSEMIAELKRLREEKEIVRTVVRKHPQTEHH